MRFNDDEYNLIEAALRAYQPHPTTALDSKFSTHRQLVEKAREIADRIRCRDIPGVSDETQTAEITRLRANEETARTTLAKLRAVTREDRTAAKALWDFIKSQGPFIDTAKGKAIGHAFLQAFARHREQAQRTKPSAGEVK